jgi:hypothetical protein
MPDFPLMKATQFLSGHFADALRQGAQYQGQQELPLVPEGSSADWTGQMPLRNVLGIKRYNAV